MTRGSDLEFDHIEAFARGGEATTANIRLRCRAHNQYEAERTFGAGFMEAKRRGADRDVLALGKHVCQGAPASLSASPPA